jgi:hypothetical protein
MGRREYIDSHIYWVGVLVNIGLKGSFNIGWTMGVDYLLRLAIYKCKQYGGDEMNMLTKSLN